MLLFKVSHSVQLSNENLSSSGLCQLPRRYQEFDLLSNLASRVREYASRPQLHIKQFSEIAVRHHHKDSPALNCHAMGCRCAHQYQ